MSLEDNNILLIPATALSKLPRLNRLRLDYNRIAALSSNILRGLSEILTELGLSRNVIREIPPDVFQVCIINEDHFMHFLLLISILHFIFLGFQTIKSTGFIWKFIVVRRTIDVLWPRRYARTFKSSGQSNCIDFI